MSRMAHGRPALLPLLVVLVMAGVAALCGYLAFGPAPRLPHSFAAALTRGKTRTEFVVELTNRTGEPLATTRYTWAWLVRVFDRQGACITDPALTRELIDPIPESERDCLVVPPGGRAQIVVRAYPAHPGEPPPVGPRVECVGPDVGDPVLAGFAARHHAKVGVLPFPLDLRMAH